MLTLAAMQFTNIVDFMIVMPLGPQLMRLFGIGPGEFSTVVAAYTIAAGITGFGSAFFLDRFDRKRALVLIYIGFIIGTFSCAFAPSYPALVAARSLTGAFGGIIGSLITSIVGDAVPISRRGFAMGIVMTSFSMASVLGVPLGLFIANLWGWHAPFIFLGGFGILVLGLGLRFIPKLRSHIVSGPRSESVFAILPEILRNSSQRWALCLGAVLMFGHFSVVVFLSPSMVANVGFTDKDLTYIYLFGGLATIVSAPWIGKLSDRLGALRVFRGAILVAVAPILIVTHLGKTPLYLALLVTSWFFVMSTARMIPMTAMVTGTVEPRRRGGFMSIYSSVQQLFIGAATTCAGLIVARGPGGELLHYDLAGYLSVVTSLACLWIATRVARVATPVKAAYLALAEG